MAELSANGPKPKFGTVEQKKAEHAQRLAEAKQSGKKAPRLRLPKKPGDARSGWSPPAGLLNATVKNNLLGLNAGVRRFFYHKMRKVRGDS